MFRIFTCGWNLNTNDHMGMPYEMLMYHLAQMVLKQFKYLSEQVQIASLVVLGLLGYFVVTVYILQWCFIHFYHFINLISQPSRLSIFTPGLHCYYDDVWISQVPLLLYI